jgi:hydrogenase maturation protein HypF
VKSKAHIDLHGRIGGRNSHETGKQDAGRDDIAEDAAGTSAGAAAGAGEKDHIAAAVITLRGVVQGVGFRPHVHRLARECGLAGTVRNFSGGIDIRVEGSGDWIEIFRRRVVQEAPPLARVTGGEVRTVAPQGLRDFSVERSAQARDQFVLVPPDIATCDRCLAELTDPKDRRYRYPFINCTDCGPRFTIIRKMPYDRPMTTMSEFTMCSSCREEYGDIEDRRYHAQPNACPDCGPRLSFYRNGREEAGGGAALRRTVALLKKGQIAAVRGLGGFHLCCNAADSGAVHRLRMRKQRPAKPLAVMIKGLETVRECCHLSPQEENELTSPQRPIVVLRRRATGGPDRMKICREVAPDNNTLGVMLPYTPVHTLLLSSGLEAIVATSANRSGQPLIADNREALEALSGIADGFLLHDREIRTRCDDSIVRLAGGSPVPLRRARGYAPMPVRLPFSGPPVLACGPELKNTFCLTRDDHAFPSQHIGDLKNLETCQFFEQMVERFQDLFAVTPEVLAHDLHPQYLSTRYALRRAAGAEPQLPTVAVQHHHAHVAACLAENGLREAVIGVVFDGIGYGDDGHIWGAEFLAADLGGYRRRGHLKYIPLPGGDAASRQPWRMGLSYLHAIFGREADAIAGRLLGRDESTTRSIRQMLERSVNTPLASSMGRLFDAVSALLGLCQENTYEGQAAVALEVAAREAADGLPGYEWRLQQRGSELIADPGPLLRSVLEDLERGRPVAEIARRFHRSVAELAVLFCRRIRQRDGLEKAALTGGSFQNAILAGETAELLRHEGFQVLTHRQVPPNDGGVALGQAAVAACRKGGGRPCA